MLLNTLWLTQAQSINVAVVKQVWHLVMQLSENRMISLGSSIALKHGTTGSRET